ncbi:unnamed protein product (macronuclear) [Paramecium tetraurelia]|uniref:methionyl-tRNA formyltransferase n=1 Tax=Paramecium tetraurelia TaxID=5888 RepID=A0C374_PARTE|nr:uncharacterized protein GSPATT00034719001 [Paramecium tetraurelia]CAK65241.1 unnamed protein product [Paramecium tetraurelia]|eukprot:XP_001432638.1 hypothetical protein (macronuclear) [Paramecium tetraurelia strain d4-2]
MKTIFFGSGLFPLPIFQRLHKLAAIDPKLSLITVPNHSHKEKNQIKDYAAQQQFKIYQPNLSDKTNNFVQEIQEKPDLGIVCNYGYMIPSQIIDIFNKGVYVIHPSLLPKYRGAAPIQRAIMNDEQKTGVSFIEISKNKFDAGAILLRKEIDILAVDRYKELSQKLSQLTADSVEEFITNLDKFERLGQNASETTKAPKITQADLRPDFNNTANKIYNQYRGIYGTNFHSLKLKYQEREFYLENITLANDLEIEQLKHFNAAENGTLWLIKSKQFKNNFYIKCNENSWIRVQEFRFTDRGSSQAAYTFKNQFMTDFKFDSLDNHYKLSY